VVTENVTKTVPVSHEEVRIDREPITDADRAAAHDGPAISEQEHEVVLHCARAGRPTHTIDDLRSLGE
jgi:stress response protein YsnF